MTDSNETAFERGVDAYNNGVAPEDNPYPEAGSDRAEWFNGWEAGAEADEEI